MSSAVRRDFWHMNRNAFFNAVKTVKKHSNCSNYLISGTTKIIQTEKKQSYSKKDVGPLPTCDTAVRLSTYKNYIRLSLNFTESLAL